MPSKYKNIHGHFNFEAVYEEQVRLANDGDHFLEIGCYFGRSTAYLAECIIESGKDILLHVIDTFNGEGNGTELEDGYFRAKFEENMKNCGVHHIIKIHEGKSELLSDSFEDGSLSFVYIDGYHEYETVCSDIKKYKKKLKPMKLLAGHDYQAPGVKRAVDELLGIDNLTFHQNTWMYVANNYNE